MRAIPVAAIYKMAERLLNFPYSQICRHAVAADLLSLLEEAGEPISEALAKAVVEANDFEALEELKKVKD